MKRLASEHMCSGVCDTDAAPEGGKDVCGAPEVRKRFMAAAWRTNAGLLALGPALLLLARQLIFESQDYNMGFDGVSGWSTAVYAAAVVLLLRRPANRFTLPLILVTAGVCRFAVMFSPPFLSSDVYRYAWDGVVQHAGISPYRYVPADPALAFLRDRYSDLYDHINRRDSAPTIYPPGAQMLFYGITFVVSSMFAVKTVMILFEGLTVYALLRLLETLGKRPEQVLLYAWCPLLIWEIGCAGHLDSAAMAFIALALLARWRGRPTAVGLLLGAATMIKLYPIVLLPALYRRGDWKMPIWLAGVVLLGYGMYASAGRHIFGYLGGYAQEEGLHSGARFFLLGALQKLPGLGTLSTAPYLVLSGLLFAGLFFWCWHTCADPREDGKPTLFTRFWQLPAGANFLPPALGLAFTLMLLFSPRYPWYVAWLVPFFALLPSWTLGTYILGVYYLDTTRLAVGYGPAQFEENAILYSCVLGAFLIEAGLRCRPLHRRLHRLIQWKPTYESHAPIE